MAIKIKIELDFGVKVFIKNDPFQVEHILTGVKIVPPNQAKFILSYMGDEVELYDFECSLERDEIKYLESKDNEEDD